MTPTTLIALVVVPDDRGRYLVVEERDGTFYLPAGRVKRGESLTAGAIRETLEEAGVAIGLRGLLGFDHDFLSGSQRLRFTFVGYVEVDTPPKTVPDRHGNGARWATRAEIAALPLRHAEVLTWIDRYERRATLLPVTAYQTFGMERPPPSSLVMLRD